MSFDCSNPNCGLQEARLNPDQTDANCIYLYDSPHLFDVVIGPKLRVSGTRSGAQVSQCLNEEA
jgi:hypothetical protein